MFGIKKPVEVMRSVDFIAAYSEKPFAEAKSESRYPDYSFHKVDGMHWCVRIGEIKILWGFGVTHGLFVANGEITLSRKNVSALSLDGKGFDYTRCGDIFYLSEENYIAALKPELLNVIRSFAQTSSPDTFKIDINSIGDYPPMKEFLDKNRLTISSVFVKLAK